MHSGKKTSRCEFTCGEVAVVSAACHVTSRRRLKRVQANERERGSGEEEERQRELIISYVPGPSPLPHSNWPTSHLHCGYGGLFEK